MLELTPPRRLHIRRDGRTEGPCAVAYVRQLLASGALSRDDLVWVEGTTSWTPLSTVPGFEDLADASAHAGSLAPAYHHVSPVKFAVMSFCTEIVPFGS